MDKEKQQITGNVEEADPFAATNFDWQAFGLELDHQFAQKLVPALRADAQREQQKQSEVADDEKAKRSGLARMAKAHLGIK